MKRFHIVLCIFAFFASQSGFAQGDPAKNYEMCKHWELIEQIRAYEDTLAFGASLPDTLRGEYGLPVTDAGVISKVYRIYNCSALLDTLAGLQADLTFQRATAPVLVTDSVSAITATSATFHAKVTSDGGLPVLHQWFRFGTSSTSLTDSVDASALTTTPFTLNVTTLGSGTYYVAAFAKNAKGTASGDTLSFTTFTCGTSTVSYDGYDYATVSINTQCWFKENLRTTIYRDNSVISTNLDNAAWMSTTSGAQTVYGEGASAVIGGSSDEVANLATYGRLYNWYAVNTGLLCPTGWHVPTDAEWTTLEIDLGISPGAQLKATSPAWDGTNTSGFSALPGGYRAYNVGDFYFVPTYGYWWTSTANGGQAWRRNLDTGNPNVPRYSDYPQNGFSVRCIRD